MQITQKDGPDHSSVTMDTILLEVDTVGSLPHYLQGQGRVVVSRVDMGTLGVMEEVVYRGKLSLECWHQCLHCSLASFSLQCKLNRRQQQQN